MSDQGSYPPPPGQVPPGQPHPGQPYPGQPYPGQPYPGQPYPGQPYPGQPYPPQPGMAGAAHKPGAIALRPLLLGDVLDGAFRIIRFNPRATVGAALLVAAVAMAIPVVITSVLTVTVGTAPDPAAFDQTGSGALAGFGGGVVSILSTVLGSVLLQVGVVLVTGLVAHVTHEAAVGRKIGLADAWERTRGRRWRLIGLVVVVALGYVVLLGLWGGSVVAMVAAGLDTVVVVLYGVLSGLVVLVLTMLFYVRLTLLATPALMLEDVGVLGALGRSWRLSRSQFWRLFGIALLTGLITGIVGYVLALPLGIVAQVAAFAVPEYSVLLLVVGNAVSSVLSTAFTAPFTAAVTSLLYLDQRMRKEAYDVELMSRAGITRA